MKENEAIKYIENHGYISDDVKDMTIKALEKQIPKKPKTNDSYIMYICPCCNNFIKLCKNYCEYCGQKLDWSDEE